MCAARPRAAPLEQHTTDPVPAETASSSKVTPRRSGKSSDSRPPRPQPAHPSTPPRATKSTPSARPRSANSSVPARKPASARAVSSSACELRRAAQPSRPGALRSGMSATELARSAASQRVESRVRTRRDVDAALSPPCRRATGGDDAPRLGGVDPRAISFAISAALPAACYASAAPTLSPAVRYAFPASASSTAASEAGGSTYLSGAMAAAAAGPCAGAAVGAAAVGSCQRGGHFDRGHTTEALASSEHREAMRRLMAVPAPLAASLCATSLCAAAGGAPSPRRATVEADCGGRGSSAELRGEHTKDKPERLTSRGEGPEPLYHRLHHSPTSRPPAVRPSTPRLPTSWPPSAQASRRAPVSASPRAGSYRSSSSSSSSSSSRLRCPRCTMQMASR